MTSDNNVADVFDLPAVSAGREWLPPATVPYSAAEELPTVGLREVEPPPLRRGAFIQEFE